jgi:hypothetical protein
MEGEEGRREERGGMREEKRGRGGGVNFVFKLFKTIC